MAQKYDPQIIADQRCGRKAEEHLLQQSKAEGERPDAKNLRCVTHRELHSFLEEHYDRYNRPDFIPSDPISIPHRFSKKQDIEISGFLAATIAWGQRPTILRNAGELMRKMDNAPHDFILNHTKTDLAQFKNFKHRTFNGVDCTFFLKSLQNIYKKNHSLEDAFYPPPGGGQRGRTPVRSSITNFRKIFFSIPHPHRTQKHVSSPPPTPSSGGHHSACKRINMFLRWMVRQDKRGVDFGIWGCFPPLKGADTAPVGSAGGCLQPSQLMCPLDIHSGNMARKLGLLTRKQNDWQSVEELTSRLREFDPKDPVKYDFALFGLGVFGKI